VYSCGQFHFHYELHKPNTWPNFGVRGIGLAGWIAPSAAAYSTLAATADARKRAGAVLWPSRADSVRNWAAETRGLGFETNCTRQREMEEREPHIRPRRYGKSGRTCAPFCAAGLHTELGISQWLWKVFMLAKLKTFSLLGIEAVPVEVEVDVAWGAAEDGARRPAGSRGQREHASRGAGSRVALPSSVPREDATRSGKLHRVDRGISIRALAPVSGSTDVA
jgi:hypothetical protein